MCDVYMGVCIWCICGVCIVCMYVWCVCCVCLWYVWYVYIWYMYVCVVCVCAHLCMPVRGVQVGECVETINVLPYHLPHSLDTGSLTEPEALFLARVPCQNPESPVSAPIYVWLQVHAQPHPAFDMSPGHPNSGPHACIASILTH